MDSEQIPFHLANTMDESQQEDTDALKARASHPMVADFIQNMAEWGFNNQDHTMLWDSMCLVIEADERGEFEEHIDMWEEANYEAETFESQYAGGFGSGSLSGVGLSSNQLTSTWGSGDFDSASLNSSGHQNVFARAEGETHGHVPHDYYTPVGPSETPDNTGYVSHDSGFDINSFMAEGPDVMFDEKDYIAVQDNTATDFIMDEFIDEGEDYDDAEDYARRAAKKLYAAEYEGPSTLSSALSGARKTGRNGKHLTIIQRLVAKYGIDKGVKIYKHFGIKQKRASPKVRGKTRGTKSGPRRYSEGRVGGAGRSQVYQNGDRTGSWTKSGGHTTRYANSGAAWYQERGMGTPAVGPVPDTELAERSLGAKARGGFVNPAGIVGYPFVPAQSRENRGKR